MLFAGSLRWNVRGPEGYVLYVQEVLVHLYSKLVQLGRDFLDRQYVLEVVYIFINRLTI